ncbi:MULTISPECIES: DUF502 domain-containing protein [unclassified Roseateles]|uniref:DUF502 domain-containing protein n=1 Tax=unclassified Roseateles TaxID=2626991 RepID=UPI0006F365CB|nr:MULTISPECIES: DUF502 domain-containing protein [unclassified Roseateles]KQW41956.1 hypothetical protein ASC81_21825 [Pelomonas sp. Root405]KRA67559.1 hypothetical protein ASD88_23410 [Pelomonas sp. Root662]
MGASLRKYLVAGLLVWLPLAITIWVLAQVLGVVNGVFGSMLAAVALVMPDAWRDGILGLEHVPGLGLVILAAGLLATGVFVANIFGQWLLTQWDRLMSHIPIVKSIYSSVKQVSDTLFSSSGNAFREAVLVQYPRAGSWTIAFVTGTPSGEVACHLDDEHVSIYVPTTPNPTSGFFLIVPKADVRPLHMTVDEALKYIISMGTVSPLPHPLDLGAIADEAARNQPG